MHSPWLHRCALLLALFTLLVVATGDAVTTNQERPLYSFGQIHPWAVAVVGVLTFGLAIGLSRTDKRAWLRRLAWVALAAVPVQAALGLWNDPQPPAARFCQAFLAQLLFTAIVAIAICTSNGWERSPEPVEGASTLRFLEKVTPFVVLAQVALGLAYRHGFMGVASHIIGAFVVVFFILGLVMSVIYNPQHASLSTAAKTLLTIASVQVFVGMSLFTIQSMNEINPVAVIVMTVIHAATGALTLAATVATALLVLHLKRGRKAV